MNKPDTTLCTAVRPFPYSPHPTVKPAMVQVGDEVEIIDELVAGLKAEEFIVVGKVKEGKTNVPSTKKKKKGKKKKKADAQTEPAGQDTPPGADGDGGEDAPVEIPDDWAELNGPDSLKLARALGAKVRTKADAQMAIATEVTARAHADEVSGD